MTFVSRMKVRFGDEDHAQIVYYPRFFHFFHTAFEDFFEEQGYPYRDCLTVDRVGWPAVHAEIDFVKPARFGDVLEIEVSVARIGEKSATFDYRARCGADPICRGRVVVACMSMDTYTSCPVPEKYRVLFERHLTPG